MCSWSFGDVVNFYMIITGITGMEGHKSGVLGLFVILFLLLSYTISILIAIATHTVIKPGQQYSDDVSDADDDPDASAEESSYHNVWLDILRYVGPLIIASLFGIACKVT